jgi:putative transposase
MTKWKKLSHTIYQCKYHIVWCPKYRYKIMKGVVAEFVEQTLRMLCEWKDIEILEMNVKEDHIHRILSLPPRLSISSVMGMLKGKTAIKLFKSFPTLKKKPYWGNHFWSRGCGCVVYLYPYHLIFKYNSIVPQFELPFRLQNI